jgi:hypothetical protein
LGSPTPSNSSSLAIIRKDSRTSFQKCHIWTNEIRIGRTESLQQMRRDQERSDVIESVSVGEGWTQHHVRHKVVPGFTRITTSWWLMVRTHAEIMV